MSDYGFVPLGISSPIANNRQSFGERNYSGEQRFNNRKQFNRHRRNNQQRFNDNRSFNNSKNNTNNEIAQYFHPSMLENPWNNLMNNLNASYVSNSSYSFQNDADLSIEKSGSEDQPQQKSPEDLTTHPV